MPIGGEPERNQGQRVVLELTKRIPTGYNITKYNFFTSLQLGQAFLNRQNPLTFLGTMRKNKTHIPKIFLNVCGRDLYSSKFGFDERSTSVTYTPKARKNVILLSTQHHDRNLSGEDIHFKPEIILYYNQTKGKVDLMDQKLAT